MFDEDWMTSVQQQRLVVMDSGPITYRAKWLRHFVARDVPE